MKLQQLKEYVSTEDFREKLAPLYPGKVTENAARYGKLLEMYEQEFGSEDADIRLFSAPGRTEIGGNHTDHQHGRVLAASVDMDMIAAASMNDSGIIRIKSQGYPICEISVSELDVKEEEKNSTASLIRGIAAYFARQEGCAISGLDAVVMSAVLPGSGISSSAAFEVLVGNIINTLFNEGKADAVKIAQIGQYAENVYFGKPSGLMDQMASSVGNILTIDFADNEHPVVRRLNVDFEKTGLALCIIDSGADHADLTDEYAAIPKEMKKVCALFGKKVLREIPREKFMARLHDVRKAAGDRAVLRSIHFYTDNDRVPLQAKALEQGDYDTFLELVKESGRSSWMCLQNITPLGSSSHQEMAVALAVCHALLGERGAFRVHGGGFAGTCQAFVPVEMLESFKTGIIGLLGVDRCHVLHIRSVGGCCVL
ncbi:MAG: galactokinase [Lachnospiraceae bacterium]|nr:galactokinase [Lachnospiraceae bacterium]